MRHFDVELGKRAGRMDGLSVLVAVLYHMSTICDQLHMIAILELAQSYRITNRIIDCQHHHHVQRIQ
ncbi:MAG: hypothetical protein C0404_03810 [Verrucomicrobia bacterium]|nr:hypothetical protein [Verrucomicrobiota bacterium]